MNIWSDSMKWIENIMSNQVLFYSFLAIFCIGTIVLFTLIYMDRKNLKLFQAEEKNLLDELTQFEDSKEEIKITQINEEKKPKTNLEEVLEKMQADLDKKEDVVAIFEQEQEEKAIISYQELLQSKNKNVEGSNKELLSVIEQISKPDINVYEEVGEPIEAISSVVEEPIEVISPVVEETRKFKTTDFISPVYGKQNSNIKYPKIPNFNELKEAGNNIELEKKVDAFEELDSNHNDAFLNALKEFRSHLE